MFRLISRSLFLTCCLSLVGAPSLAAADHKVIALWPEGVPDQHPDVTPDREENERVWDVDVPTLTVFPAPADKAVGTAVIVCPGGGYARLSAVKEGSEIAEWFNTLGVTAFVLRYRLGDYGHPQPLRDALRAIRAVRADAEHYGVRPNRIGIIGFSAGGHLAASASTLFAAPEGKTGAPLDGVSGRPDFSILMYPVITMQDKFTHAGSRRNLLGNNPSAALVDHLSTELQVTANIPPTFVFHTQEDGTVPVENALLYYSALRAAGVPGELHIYEKGPHGVGMRPPHAAALAWPAACETWMRSHGWLTRL